MSRLVVVSNRVAMPNEHRAGGLAVAMRAALKEHGGMWFGWSGKRTKDASGTLHTLENGNTTYCTMDLSVEDFDHYYNGFANRTLWPLLHFRLDLVDYRRDTQDGYRRVNALFAEKLAAQLREDDIVWVHDYHMIPLAQRLRELGVGNRIGFFLHVPMPSSDLLAALAESRSVVQLARLLRSRRVPDRARPGSIPELRAAVHRRQGILRRAHAHRGWARVPRGRVPDQHRHRLHRATGEGREHPCIGAALARKPGRARADHRRGSPRLLEGLARSLPRVRALPRSLSRPPRSDHVSAARAGLAQRSAGIPGPAP